MMDKLTEFKTLGMASSYHLAGELSEWRVGLELQNKAVRCYLAARPSEKIFMRNIARGFLWDLDMEIANLRLSEKMDQDHKTRNRDYPM